MNKQYLGDGVYAEMQEPAILALTTEEGVSKLNEIYLEPEVYLALVAFVKQHWPQI